MRLEGPGQTAQLTATAWDVDGNEIEGFVGVWSSTHPALASVDATGLVTAHSDGLAGVSVRVGAHEATALVNVDDAWRHVDVGPGTTCGVRTSGLTHCWGAMPPENGSQPMAAVEVQGGGLLRLRAVAVGDGYACGLDESGFAFCWGENGFGQAGVGSDGGWVFDAQPVCGAAACSPVPLVVAGAPPASDVVVTQRSTCVIEAGTGALWCWGASVPRRVATEVRLASISGQELVVLRASTQHACGIDEAGMSWCWGANREGQLGDGTHVDRAEPVLVSEPPP